MQASKAKGSFIVLLLQNLLITRITTEQNAQWAYAWED